MNVFGGFPPLPLHFGTTIKAVSVVPKGVSLFRTWVPSTTATTPRWRWRCESTSTGCSAWPARPSSRSWAWRGSTTTPPWTPSQQVRTKAEMRSWYVKLVNVFTVIVATMRADNCRVNGLAWLLMVAASPPLNYFFGYVTCFFMFSAWVWQ